MSSLRDKLDGDVLDLSMSNIREVPVRELAQLSRLRCLDLSSNQIKSLPPNFGNLLPQLVRLDLSANKLESLPKSFHQLTSLRHLDLYNNQITDLPESLHHLKSLRFLDLKNNPLRPELCKVVGPCLSQKECEAAAKRLVSHFTREKQKALEQQNLLVRAKEGRGAKEKKGQKEEKGEKKEEEKPVSMEKKGANRKERRAETKGRQKEQAKAAPEAGSSKAGSSKARRQRGGKSSSGGWLNSLLVLAILATAAWCLHIHVEGDYSEAGFRAAVPRLQKNLQRFRNMTAEALQPEHLQATALTVLQKVNATAHSSAQLLQQGAYAAQEALEEYTGDLTPYTSQVSRGCGVAWGWVLEQTCCLRTWLRGQDWQGMWDSVVQGLSLLWGRLRAAWGAFVAHPQVQAVAALLYAHLCSAWEVLQALCLSLLQYLGKNGPVWVDMAREASVEAFSNLKGAVEKMFR